MDRKHFEYHPQHDSAFTHGSATASRSTSAGPSTARSTRGPALTDVGTDLEIAQEALSGDEEPVHGGESHLRLRAADPVTVRRRPTTGSRKTKVKTLPQIDPERRLVGIMRRKEVGDIPENDERDNERETSVAQSGCCTRSQLGRTAPPEITDAEELCTECKIRARTSGAGDCARCVFLLFV